MAGAIRWLTPRSGIGARAVAVVACLWLVVGGLLRMQHEAEVPHVRDRGGQVFHGAAPGAPQLDADRETRVHDRGSALHDHRTCALASYLPPPAAPGADTAASTVPTVEVLPGQPGADHDEPPSDLYLLAPKTSPPLA